MLWIEYQGPLEENLVAGWLAMHDANTAVASVFRDQQGRYLIVYSILGQGFPSVERFFRTLKSAQARAERAVEEHIIRPRYVMTIGASYYGKEWQAGGTRKH